LTGGGLLYLKIDSWLRKEGGRNWYSKVQWTPFLDPLPAIVYFSAMAFLAFAAFAKPANTSPFAEKVTQYAWYLVPAIGLSSLLWGVLWWFGLELAQWKGRFGIQVSRIPYLDKDSDGNYVQRVELVEHGRLYTSRQGDGRNFGDA
jgi:hypothetical protein